MQGILVKSRCIGFVFDSLRVPGLTFTIVLTAIHTKDEHGRLLGRRCDGHQSFKGDPHLDHAACLWV